MKIHHETLADVNRYLEHFGDEDLRSPAKRVEYDRYLNVIRPYLEFGPKTRILEIGTGTGWFPILCALDGLSCKGLEISPQLIEHAKKVGQKYGVDPDIELGNIEDNEIGNEEFDAIIASSVFEHIEHWQKALRRIHRALKPGGLFYFSSTNKFSFISSEYNFPLYGWLPDQWRFKLRIARQGPDIMKLGIDFNQFRHGQLRREFREVGFSRVYDRIERAHEPGTLSPLKKSVTKTLKALPPLKALYLAFCDATIFVCIK